MPNAHTFSIPPIRALIHRYTSTAKVIVDPFANSERIATITNDLDTQYDTDYHMDACEFLKMLPSSFADAVLYDPPYSSRQVAESYKKLGMSVNMETTQGSYWRKQKEQISRITKTGGGMYLFWMEQRRHRQEIWLRADGNTPRGTRGRA